MGNIGSYLAQSFPPKPKFNVVDIPDLSGKVMIVTGGNGGIGYEIIKVLLTKNAKVYMASRSQERADVAIAKLRAETGGQQAIYLHLDLSSLDSVRKAAEEFKSKESELHVLFNNAGVMASPIDQLTADGYDLQFGTNCMGHYVFTKRLLPALLAGAKTSADKNARIVNLASSAQMFATTINLEAMKGDESKRRKLGSSTMYMQSKLGNVLLSNELAHRYGDQGIVSTSMNPGNLKTDIQRNTPAAFMFLFGWMFSPAPFGALTPLWAGVSPEAVDFNGKYLIPWARVGETRSEKELGERMWMWLKTETKE